MSLPAKIGAFFDLDGTVVAPPSLEWRFVAYLLAHDALDTRDIGRWLGHFAKNLLLDPRAATTGNKQYLAGLRESLVTDWEQLLADDAPFYPEAIERISWHGSQGHRVFLVSGTLDCLAQAVARHLPGCVEIRGTQLESINGRWTGRLASPHMSGREKARAIRNLASRFGLSLWESYAYGNSMSDLPMLDSVGRRMAVNPTPQLRRIARSEGWPVCDWKMPARSIKFQKPRPRQFAAKEAR